MKLSGTTVAGIIKDICKARTGVLKKFYRPPKLAIIQVGDNPASTVYVANKVKDCAEVGIDIDFFNFAADPDGIRHLIHGLNNNNTIDGIMCQLPMEGIDALAQREILDAIAIDKDVDGLRSDVFTTINAPFSSNYFIPCTPHGVLMLLNAYGIDNLGGMKTTVVGRSNLVTKPLAQLLINEGAMVTIAHSGCDRRDIISAMRGSRLIISGVGQAGIWNFSECVNIANQPIVIDIGTSKNSDNNFAGDFYGIELMKHSDMIHYTPVPGGVGPMTRAALLLHTVDSWEQRLVTKGDLICSTLEMIDPQLNDAYKKLLRQSKLIRKS